MAITFFGNHTLAGNISGAVTFIEPSTFSSFTFTSAGQTGLTGPTLVQARSAYVSNGQFNENDTNVFNVTNGYQTFVVPTTGTYRFTVSGASGGVWTTSPVDAATGDLMPTIDGYKRMPGASIVGDYALTAGQIITFVVGQGGGDDDNAVANCPGGGGGTFVTLGDYNSVVAATDTLLFAAGGGGGCGYNAADGLSVTLGTNSFNIGRGQAGTSGATSNQAGGTNGAGTASAAGANSNGGAGYLTNAPTTTTGTSFGGAGGTTGYAFRKGAIGATAGQTVGTRGFGGFGGGGGGAASTSSDDDKGGGGGYSGGGYAFDGVLCGGGGGSYASPSATGVTITAGGNTTGRHGSVQIQLL